jgi:hypothetical protein
MPEVLPSRPRPTGTYAAIAVFIVAYLGVLVLVLAPRDMIGVDAGAAIYSTEN